MPFIVKQEGGLTYLPSVYTLSTSFSNVVITKVFKHKITHNSFKIIYKSFQSWFYFCIQNQKFPMIAGQQHFKVISMLTKWCFGRFHVLPALPTIYFQLSSVFWFSSQNWQHPSPFLISPHTETWLTQTCQAIQFKLKWDLLHGIFSCSTQKA